MQKKFCRALLSLALTGIALLAYAQNPLKIGDALPKQFWETPLQMVNTPQKTTTLSADKDKLILLDFWATWCGSCLKNFPKMEALQKQFGDRIKILPVTDQSHTVLENYFYSPNGKRYSHTASVAGDKVFHQLFPHNGIPFIVWIKEGKLLNTTDADQVTMDAIDEVLQGNMSSLQTVLNMDRSRPLMLSDNFEVEKGSSLLGYAFISKGRIRAVGYGTYFHRDGTLTYGRQFTNQTLTELYKGLAYELFRKLGDQFTDKRLINLAKNPEEIDFDVTALGKGADHKLYNIDFIVPKSLSETLYDKMLKFVNENTGYIASVENRQTKCLVLKRTSNIDKIATKGNGFVDGFLKKPSVLQNASLEYMISALNAENKISSLPVIDETDYKGKVDLVFPEITDLATLQKALEKYDLALEETERLIPMLIIKDSNSNKPKN